MEKDILVLSVSWQISTLVMKIKIGDPNDYFLSTPEKKKKSIICTIFYQNGIWILFVS